MKSKCGLEGDFRHIESKFFTSLSPHLHKPFPMKDLAAKIREALARM
jgi:hypothetical protein